MPAFKRYFDKDDTFSDWYDRNPGSAVHELFRRWARPGTPSEGDACLRLAVRGGYLNFYVKGQSVAKLSCGTNGPIVSVHEAYVEGRSKGTERVGPAPAKSYVSYDSATLANPATAQSVETWVQTAETYASAEKRFVDDLVAANAGTIDLEMGLPASDLPDSERVAPRMDLVVVQLTGGTDPSIAFWEAKCANNGELRADGESTPKVRGQIRKYVDWMAAEGRMSEVQQAYRATANALLKLQRISAQSGNSKLDCTRYWEALAEAEAPKVIVQPGVVIGNYWPQGSTEGIASERMRQCAKTFQANGHRKKLEVAGISLHQVGPDHEGPTLPMLALDRSAA